MSLSKKVIGEVKEVFCDRRSATVNWRIPGCSRLERGNHYAPKVRYFNMDWQLGVFKDGNGIHSVYLQRELLTHGIPQSIHFTIRWKTSNGEERDVAREETFPEDRNFRGLSIDPPCRIPSGVTLLCSMWTDDSPPAPGVSREIQTEDSGFRAISSLSEHFKKLLISGTGHDALIKIGDKQFRAHKHILEARSPVFAAMFGNEMAESAEGSVTIEDCDRDSFGEFLRFVYSGKADIASVGRALGLYYAGDKYDFPNLKKMCVEFLKNSFTTTTVFEVVSLAARHDEEELLHQAIVYFAENLEEVMLSVEWQRFLEDNPVQADEMSLKAIECLKTSLYKK